MDLWSACPPINSATKRPIFENVKPFALLLPHCQVSWQSAPHTKFLNDMISYTFQNCGYEFCHLAPLFWWFFIKLFWGGNGFLVCSSLPPSDNAPACGKGGPQWPTHFAALYWRPEERLKHFFKSLRAHSCSSCCQPPFTLIHIQPCRRQMPSPPRPASETPRRISTHRHIIFHAFYAFNFSLLYSNIFILV